MSLARYSLLVGVTAVLIKWLPGYLRAEPPVIIDGFVAKGFEEVRSAFRDNFELGRDDRSGGSAFSVYHRGELVVNLWGGYADIESEQEWREETMSIFFSTTKGVAAICIAMLADRGLLDYDEPVARYWPEFAQKGKGKITVRQMMEHQGGLVLAAPPGFSFELLRDVARAGELMARTEPLWKPDGETHGYHTISFGPLANELLRRVDPKHRTMGQFFAEEVSKPLGLDFFIGLPFEENYRTARFHPSNENIILHSMRGASSPENRQLLWHLFTDSLFQESLKNANMGEGGVFNNPYIRKIEIASAGGIGTARSVAQLYGILAAGGTDREKKKTIMSKPMIDKLFTAKTPSPDKTLGVPIAFNLGLMAADLLDGEMFYGHPGAGGQMGYADPTHELGIAFVSTSMSPFFLRDDPRTVSLLKALYKSIRALEKN